MRSITQRSLSNAGHLLGAVIIPHDMPGEKHHCIFASALYTSIRWPYASASIAFQGEQNEKNELTKKVAEENMIENYIRYYNNRRTQRGLGILTPMEKHNLYLTA